MFLGRDNSYYRDFSMNLLTRIWYGYKRICGK